MGGRRQREAAEGDSDGGIFLRVVMAMKVVVRWREVEVRHGPRNWHQAIFVSRTPYLLWFALTRAQRDANLP